MKNTMESFRKHKIISVTAKSVALSSVIMLSSSFVNAQKLTEQQSVSLVESDTGNSTRGDALLIRAEDSLDLELAMMDLDPNNAYSVWWVMFNEPENCMQPYNCDEMDIVESLRQQQKHAPKSADAQTPIVKIAGFYATGFITNSSGEINVSAQLDVQNLPSGMFVDNRSTIPVKFDPDENADLLEENGLKAEVHVVVRSHGPTVPENLIDQITTFNGLCDVQECTNVQAAIFRAPGTHEQFAVDPDDWGWNDGEGS